MGSEIQAEPFGRCLLFQVNRGLRDFIQASPYTAYRIDLFTAGLEDNPAVNLSLADKRRAFNEYRAKWDAFKPTQKWEQEVENFHSHAGVHESGVFGFIAGEEQFIHFLVPESASGGIPRKEWRLSFPDISLNAFAIDPHADVLAIVERNEA